MQKAVALMFFAAAAAAAPQWCAGPSVAHVDPAVGEARGTFRDLSLYVHTGPMGFACRDFKEHVSGNDGLWLLEYDFEEEMAQILPNIKAAAPELQLHLQQNRTLIVSGGGALPDILGLDTCGGEKNKRVISISPKAVIPVKPYTAEERLQFANALKKKNDAVAAAVAMVNVQDVYAFIQTMEDYNSRNSYTGSDLVNAANWLADQYLSFNGSVSRDSFRNDMAQQVFAEFPGQGPNPKILVVGAHYDSRSTANANPTMRAPGADDNGTGSAALLMLAKVLRQSQIRLTHTIILMSFTGEEQGLLGSRSIAQRYAAQGVELVGMLNADMLGWRQPNTPVTVAYMNRHVDAEFTAQGKAIVQQYIPGVAVGDTSGCCSDQQSFSENGFRSLGMFETPTSAVVYPHYHRSTDLLQYLDAEQILIHTEALVAQALVFAEPLDS